MIGFLIFTMGSGYWFTTNTLGHMENYKLNCDESFIVPNIPHIDSTDQSYYFDNPDATCDKLYFLSYFLSGLTFFVVGMGLFTLIRFLYQTEITIVMRRRK